jgi:hypothetical protein
MPKGNPFVVQSLKLALIEFVVVQHDADLLARLQSFEIVPIRVGAPEGRPRRYYERGNYQHKEQNLLRLIDGSTSLIRNFHFQFWASP